MTPDQTTKTAAASANTTTPDAGRKRRSEVIPASAKRAPISPKEEKENELNLQPSSSSSSSTSFTSNLSVTVKEEPTDLPEIATTITTTTRRRTKCHPKRLEDVQKTLKTSDDPNMLHEYYRENGDFPSRNVRFLVTNVVQKKAILAGNVICRQRVMPKIRDEADRLLERMAQKMDEHHLTTLDFTKVNSWGNSMDASSYDTSSAAVQSFAVMMNSQGEAQVKKLGLSVVSLSQKSVTQNREFTKQIHLAADQFTDANKIYIVVIVKRMVAKEERRGATRIAAAGASASNAIATPRVLEQKTRIGATLIFDRFGRNYLNHGYDRIILVDSSEKPEFEAIFTDMLTAPVDWMTQSHNLEILAHRNTEKEDQHLPRLLFFSEAPRFYEIEQALKNRRAQPVIKTEPIENDRHKISRLLDAKMDVCWLASRFPCYDFIRDEETGALRPVQNIDYFESNTVETHKNACLYRPMKERSKGAKRRIHVDGEDAMEMDEMDYHHENPHHRYIPQPPQNIGPDGKRLNGLLFKMPRGHASYAPCTFGNRAIDKVPQLDEHNPKTYRDEPFIRHNPRVYTEFMLSEKRLDDVPAPEIRTEKEDMYLAEEPVTQEQVDSYNKELEDVKVVKKLRPGAIEKEDDRPKSPGRASDGLLVPWFSEMFFPAGKNEIYNIMLRYYLTEVGTRAGSFTPEWRSRVLTGFVEKYHVHIFTHNLSEQFEKQLQCMAFTSHMPWKPEHFNRPWDKLNELRKKWVAEHPRDPSPDHSPTRALRSRRASSPGPSTSSPGLSPTRARRPSRASSPGPSTSSPGLSPTRARRPSRASGPGPSTSSPGLSPTRARRPSRASGPGPSPSKARRAHSPAPMDVPGPSSQPSTSSNY